MAKQNSDPKASQQSEQEKRAARAALKVANFNKLAPKRMTKALKALDQVARLGNRNSYTYDDAQKQKIFAALASAVQGIQSAFEKTEGAKPAGFTF